LVTTVFERVHTVTDFWDGPREGVADFRGAPHVYRSVWRRELDEWDDDRFFLFRITPEHASLALEDWAIWERFVEHYGGRTAPVPEDRADWGALAEDLPRRRELRRLLAPVLDFDRSRCLIAQGEFRSRGSAQPPGMMVPRLEVRWRLAGPQPDDELLPSTAV
jgi:hypothetical protein